MLYDPSFLHSHDLSSSQTANILRKGLEKRPTVCSMTSTSYTVTTYLPYIAVIPCINVVGNKGRHALLSLLITQSELIFLIFH